MFSFLLKAARLSATVKPEWYVFKDKVPVVVYLNGKETVICKGTRFALLRANRRVCLITPANVDNETELTSQQLEALERGSKPI